MTASIWFPLVAAVVLALRRELEVERRRRLRAEKELDRLTAWIAERLPPPRPE
jgi:hypothetical protein